MSEAYNFKILNPNLQVGFYYKLLSIKDLYFQEALKNTVSNLKIREIDQELSKFVSNESLQKLASFSIRGEIIFPVPIVLKNNPFLLGYYRLLLGFSQKEFYSKGDYGKFKLMEEKGTISSKVENIIEELCISLIKSCEYLVAEIDEFSVQILNELQLLTIGPQLRGSMNNEYGQVATQKTFSIIKELVKKYIEYSTLNEIVIRNDSKRFVKIKFSADPDIEITESLTSSERGLVSVEIKGGRDISNIHNRIGEAEKSHQKAKGKGHIEFITILSVDIDYQTLKNESPTTTHFFHIDRLSNKNSSEFKNFKDILSSILSINI